MKKHEAHEVARDATAWAFTCLGPMFSTTCSLAWARLDPISTSAALRQMPAQTVDRDCFRRGRTPIGALSGFPTGRPWVSLADVGHVDRPCNACCANRSSSRTLVPRIRRALRRLTPTLARLGCDARHDGVLSTRGAGIVTSGDV